MYTHWEQKINARPGNYGGRIDFVLVAESMKSWVQDANIQEGLLGSDHCPVFADFKDTVQVDDREVPLLDVMHPPGTFVDGKRKKEFPVHRLILGLHSDVLLKQCKQIPGVSQDTRYHLDRPV